MTQTRALIDRLRSFPDFAEIPDEVGPELVAQARVMRVPEQEILATQGSPCAFFPLCLSGRARIFAMDEDGREITLYRIGPGEGCVLAAACSVSGEPLPGSVIIEDAGEGLFIPAAAFLAWVERHTFWRGYLFSLVARQLGRIVAVTNDLAFRRLDVRIAGFLLEGAKGPERVVRATHQGIAMEVGTRREVASRILKAFEQDGIVTLERGAIRVRDGQALAKRAQAGLLPGLVT